MKVFAKLFYFYSKEKYVLSFANLLSLYVGCGNPFHRISVVLTDIRIETYHFYLQLCCHWSSYRSEYV